MPRGGDKQTRQQRLAAKLRENLKRRKKQAAERKPTQDTGHEDRSGSDKTD